MKYLLLGGTGFIGSHLATVLSVQHQVVVTGRRERHFDAVDGIEYRQLDVVKCEDFTEYIKDVDTVIYMVSTIIPSEDTTRIEAEIAENVFPVVRMLNSASKIGKEVVFISSGGAIYGDQNGIIKENAMTKPKCNYGIVKLLTEEYLELYGKYYGLRYKIIRPSNPYSEKVYHNKKQGVVPIMIDNARKGVPMMIYGDPVRDYIHIDDLVSGIKAILEYEGERKVFNVGTGKGYSLSDVIEKVEVAVGKPLIVERKAMRKCDVSRNVLDISLIKQETGWEPKISLDEGIQRAVLDLE